MSYTGVSVLVTSEISLLLDPEFKGGRLPLSSGRCSPHECQGGTDCQVCCNVEPRSGVGVRVLSPLLGRRGHDSLPNERWVRSFGT